MALHQAIQHVLLIGVHLEPLARTPTPSPPAALTPLIEAIAPCHRAFDERAIDYGDRYRSGFWAIYLLSASAVLFAVLPLALGWDSPGHRLHSYAAHRERSEEHTSELQSRFDLVCRLLLEKKKQDNECMPASSDQR